MKRGVHTNKVEIFEICDFDTGMIIRKVLINDKLTYEETVTAIIDRQSADKGSKVKQFIDWLLGIEHINYQVVLHKPKHFTYSDWILSLFRKKEKGLCGKCKMRPSTKLSLCDVCNDEWRKATMIVDGKPVDHKPLNYKTR